MVRYTPWDEIPRLESWLWTRTRDLSALASNGDARQPLWQPAVDVHENDERILLVADLPGLVEEDVEITVEKNVLTLRGGRKEAAPAEGGYRHRERVQGPFQRTFTLPASVDVEGISAEMSAGVLTLTLPKRAEARPRQIKINTASA